MLVLFGRYKWPSTVECNAISSSDAENRELLALVIPFDDCLQTISKVNAPKIG